MCVKLVARVWMFVSLQLALVSEQVSQSLDWSAGVCPWLNNASYCVHLPLLREAP